MTVEDQILRKENLHWNPIDFDVSMDVSAFLAMNIFAASSHYSYR